MDSGEGVYRKALMEERKGKMLKINFTSKTKQT